MTLPAKPPRRTILHSSNDVDTTQTLIDMGRPRERLMHMGATGLMDAELLAIILRTGTKGMPAVTFSQHLIGHFGSLRKLLAATPQTLTTIHGMGAAKASQVAAVAELARRSIAEELTQGSVLKKPEQVKRYCQSILAHRTVEYCIALYLNTRLELITCIELTKGTVSEAVVYPREIVRSALEHNATAVILAHNHPSGSLMASAADLALTRRVSSALALVDIRLIDHLIIAGNASLSLAEEGQI